MRYSGILCLLPASLFLGSLLYGQLKTPAESPDRPVITITGLCSNPGPSASSRQCRIQIKQSQFDQLISAIDPGMSRHARVEFATDYADDLVMAHRAEELGLDREPGFQQQMQLARIQILSRALKKRVRQTAAQISEQDIERYYAANWSRFDKADVDRIIIPHGHATPGEADDLRSRAVAGADFIELQTIAYRDAGIQAPVSTTRLWLRRISLPSAESSVFDMKPGEISPVFADSNGYSIYRLISTERIPLDQARNEILETLRTERIHEEMDKITDSVKTSLDPGYFAH